MKTSRTFIIIFAVIAAAFLGYLAFTRPDTLVPALNAFLMVAMPVALGMVLAHRFGLKWSLFGAGAVTFIASQVLHIPFNVYLLNPLFERFDLQFTPGSTDLIFLSIGLGLSAGLFEETARWLVLRFWKKDLRTWREAVMYGAGHGGVEALIIGMLGFVGFIQLMAFRDMDVATMGSLVDSSQMEAVQGSLNAFWGLAWYDHLWGAVERLSAIGIHLGATILVFQSIKRRNPWGYILAVLWHAFVDFIAVYGSVTWSIAVTEAVFFVLALISLGAVFLLRPSPSQESHPPPEADQPPPVQPALAPSAPLPDQPITVEDLEESRYD